MSKRVLFFAYFMCSLVSGAKALKKCLRLARFNFSEKLQNIFEIGLKKYVVIIQKSLLKKNFRNSQTCFYFLYVKLATVQIGEPWNEFPLTCSSPPFWWKTCLEKTALKTFAGFANKLSPQTQSTGFSDNWANQRLESLLPLASWWKLRA